MIYLKRKSVGKDGIFGELFDEDVKLAVTLEHAFPASLNTYLPIAPVGVFSCVKGIHKLHGMTHPFETYEITGIKGHTNVLFHMGNYNDDSMGCVLLGREITFAKEHVRMITHSNETFEAFLKHMDLKARESFELTIEDAYEK